MSSAGQVSDETHVLDLVRTELGLLPKDWRVVRLGDLFDVRQGAAMSPKRRQGRNPRPFLRTLNVLWGRLDLSNVDQMDFSTEEVDRLALEVGDLLVCEGGEIGRTAIWRGELSECLYQNHLHRLRRRDDTIEPEFYMYWMQAAFLQLGLYGGQANKTTIPNLSRSRLMAFPVPLPPLSEQRAIAHVLRTVQQVREATDSVIAATRELKKSLMWHLFTYGPVPVDQVAQVPLKETEIGPVPEHWATAPLSSIATIRRGASPRPKGDPRYFAEDGPVPWIKISDLRLYKRGKILTRTAEGLTEEGKKKSLFVEAGTLLLTNSGTVGRPVILGIDGCIHDGFLALLDPQADIEYLYYFLEHSTRRLEELAPRGTQPNLNTMIVKSFFCPLPPLEEQREIARALTAVDSRLEAEEQRSRSLDALFQSLLHHLMTGAVRVGDHVSVSARPSALGAGIQAGPLDGPACGLVHKHSRE